MKTNRSLSNYLARSVDLDTEPIPKLPLIEVVSDKRVLIENHLGVTVYSTNEIRVRVSFGIVQICGNGMRLARITKEQLVILGCVNCVNLLRKGK